MPMSLRTTGYREMNGELELLRQAARGDATRKAVRAGATVILEAMVERAPILDKKTAESTALDPGALKADLDIKMQRVDEAGYLRAWIGPGKLTGRVAHWVEFGHFLVKGGYLSLKRGKLQGAGRRVGEVPPHPFLRPAYEVSERAALARFAEELKLQLKRWVS
jgi:HK97 gp10 family phage protein